MKGVYFGKAMAELGYTPDVEVDEQTFSDFCHGINPRTKKTLTQRQRDDRRVLTDFTFSTNKSTSVLWATTTDEKLREGILGAVQQSALEVMELIEQDAQTRVNPKRGEMHLEKTKNLGGVAWLHTTSRPVGGTPDPNLHVHATVLNFTHDRKRDRHTAVDLSLAVKDKRYYTVQFHARVASKLEKLDVPIERSKYNFEVKGLKPLIEPFSRRTTQIKEEASRNGITDKDELDALGAKTRDNKLDNHLIHDALPEIWRSRLTTEHAALIQAAHPHPKAEPKPSLEIENGASVALDWAIELKFSRSSTVRRRELVTEALLYGIEHATPAQIQQEIVQRIQSKDIHTRFEEDKEELTTQSMLEAEKAVIAYVKQGKGALRPIDPDHVITRSFLSDEQQAAVKGLLSTPSKVSILRGYAGTGKTTVLTEFTEAIKNQHLPYQLLAPSSDAAHGVLRDKEGFDAQTVSHFLLSEKAQKQVKGGVVIVDEAGLLSLKQTQQLIDVAESVNSRIVLLGDRGQHTSVGAGESLRLIETQAGVKPFEIKTIRRQQDENYRQIATLMSQGKVSQAIDKLDKAGNLIEIDDEQERARQVARDYAANVEAGKETLVVVPANKPREATNLAIRDELKELGELADTDHWLPTLTSRQLDDAQKKDALQYSAGDVIEFHRNGGSLWSSGTRVTVAAVEGDQVLADVGDTRVAVPLEKAASFDVYREQFKPFAVGETIRFSKNRKPVEGENTKRINNGGQATIEGFTKDGRIKLSGNQMISPDWAHLDHGYAVTSFKSQGKTIPHIIINQGQDSFAASDKKQAYVSITRGVKGLKLYTSDVQDLRVAVDRDRTQRLATELVALPESKMSAPRRSISQRAIEFAQRQFERLRHWQHQQQQQQQQQPERYTP